MPEQTKDRSAGGRQGSAPPPGPHQKWPPWKEEGIRPDRPGEPPPGQQPPNRWRPQRWFWPALLVLLLLNWVVGSAILAPTKRLSLPYTTFTSELDKNNVAEVSSKGDTIQGKLRHAITYPPPPAKAKTSNLFQTERPSYAKDDLLSEMKSQGVIVNAKPISQPASWWQTLLFSFGPTILLVVLFVMLMRRANSGIGGFGRSKAKLYEPDRTRTTFADVAGIEDAKEQLAEVVDYLRNPGRYQKLGASIPKGVLLTGPPGTGKTLLARAVAGEAGVPFFSIAASEFIEMIVGVGASRVRDLFETAKKNAPAIIFIDELDAIGRARGGAMSFGGHDEREQTLNQILTEMDGFTGTEGVIVIAATNRPEILDPALLRPGRFDRHVVVNPPDAAGRAAILRVHTRSVPLAPDVRLDDIAARTPGMVGADLRALVNEAALLAARLSHEAVTASDFSDALERILLGAERHILLSEEERSRTAYHEAGHALLGMLQPGADPVRKVSIIPRGRSLGVTFQAPSTDRYGYDSAYLRGRIIGALGGRAAEELIFNDMTTGAESDLEMISSIARQMVGRWGMSDAIGPVSVLPDPRDEAMLLPGSGGPSEQTRQMVDQEVRRIVEDCHHQAISILAEHRGQLDALAAALLERETLDEEEAYRVAGVPHDTDRPAAEPVSADSVMTGDVPGVGVPLR
jgi:cell division protease FtsH